MKAKSKTKPAQRALRIDPETNRPFPDEVVGLVFDFWNAWARYSMMCDTRPEKHPEREEAWKKHDDLEERISTTVPTSLRGLNASADLFKQLTEDSVIGSHAQEKWPATLAEGLRRVSGFEPPQYRLYPRRGVTDPARRARP